MFWLGWSRSHKLALFLCRPFYNWGVLLFFRRRDTPSMTMLHHQHQRLNVKAIPGKLCNNVKIIHLATHFDWCPTNPSNYNVPRFFLPLPGRWCRREWTSPADTRTADPSRGRGILYQSVFLGSPGKSLFWGFTFTFVRLGLIRFWHVILKAWIWRSFKCGINGLINLSQWPVTRAWCVRQYIDPASQTDAFRLKFIVLRQILFNFITPLLSPKILCRRAATILPSISLAPTHSLSLPHALITKFATWFRVTRQGAAWSTI